MTNEKDLFPYPESRACYCTGTRHYYDPDPYSPCRFDPAFPSGKPADQ